MQKSTFSNGGWVVHKIRPSGYRGRASAWFRADGTMIDAEYFDANNRARQVRPDSNHWRAIAQAAQAA